MIIYKVNKELEVDIGNTTFALHPGDHFEFNGEYIEVLHYTTKIPWRNDSPVKGTLQLNRERLRVFGSIRIANYTNWIPICRCVGKEIEDVTLQFNRDKILNQLFL